MKDDQMVPSCSYFPSNQTERLLADITSSTHAPLHRALCNRSGLPCPQSSCHTYWLMQVDKCCCLTGTHHSPQQLAQGCILFPISQTAVLLASSSVLKPASFLYRNTQTQSKDCIPTAKCLVNV